MFYLVHLIMLMHIYKAYKTVMTHEQKLAIIILAHFLLHRGENLDPIRRNEFLSAINLVNGHLDCYIHGKSPCDMPVPNVL